MLHHMVEALKETSFGSHMHEFAHDMKDVFHADNLPAGTSAQFAAGLLYGVSD